MDDTCVTNYLFKNNHGVAVNTRKLAKAEKEDPETYEYLSKRFLDSNSLKETVYRIVKGIESKPICPVCGKPISFNGSKFATYCSVKCMENSQAVKDKISNTSIERYGFSHPMRSDEVKARKKITSLERYGVSCSLSAKGIRDKAVSTCIEKYGCPNPSSSEAVKEKRMSVWKEKYGVDHPWKLKGIRNKCAETMRANGSYSSSKEEELCYEIIKRAFPDVIRQYSSDKYPFCCDFYIPSIDTYIEYQGSWTHGRHPFDKDSVSDIILLHEWETSESEYYRNAAYTWSVRDVNKRNTAFSSSIRFYEAWTIDELCALINTL